MPLFFFDVENTESTRDDDGVELPNVEAARVHAAHSLGSIVGDEAVTKPLPLNIAIHLRDEGGDVIYSVRASIMVEVG